MKAKFIKCLGYEENRGYRNLVYEYEYRNKRYEVIDYRNGYSVSMYQQHQQAQNEIDNALDEHKNCKKCTESFEIGLDLFFKSFEED